jgi:hypothetical protein
MSPRNSHFRDVNTLGGGGDFCFHHRVSIVVDYEAYEAKLIFKNLARATSKAKD